MVFAHDGKIESLEISKKTVEIGDLIGISDVTAEISNISSASDTFQVEFEVVDYDDPSIVKWADIQTKNISAESTVPVNPGSAIPITSGTCPPYSCSFVGGYNYWLYVKVTDIDDGGTIYKREIIYVKAPERGTPIPENAVVLFPAVFAGVLLILLFKK
jgi:hypothetical protein